MNMYRISAFLMMIGFGSVVSPSAIERPTKFNIFVVNNVRILKEYVSVPLKVTYLTPSNQPVTSIVGPMEMRFIGTGELLQLPTVFTISGYGGIKGYSVKEAHLLNEALYKEWQKIQSEPKGLKKTHLDPLVITVTAGDGFPPELKFEYSHLPPRELEENFLKIIETREPLAAFGRIRYYGLLNDLQGETLDKLSGLTSGQLNDPLVPARMLQGEIYATTGEDVFRYILGLDKNYTKDDVERAYKDLSSQWDPRIFADNLPQREFAKNVITWVKKAHDVLLEALQSKERNA